MSIPDALHAVFTEKAAQQNRVTDITIEAERITVYLEPDVAKRYARPDCQQPVVVQLHDRETIVVQGLGVQGRALLMDCNLPTALSVQMLQRLYHSETSESALARWKSGAAAHLPSVGILIQHLNEKKR